MDIKKLEKLLKKENLEDQELFEFFKVKDKKEAVELWKKNLASIKFEWNDLLGYESFSLLYSKMQDFNETPNVFYLEMMTVSLFLRTYCDYDVDVISAFVRMIGILEFGFVTNKILDQMPEYVYYKQMFEKHRKETIKFIELQQSIETLSQLQDSTQDINMEELAQTAVKLRELKEEIIDNK